LFVPYLYIFQDSELDAYGTPVPRFIKNPEYIPYDQLSKLYDSSNLLPYIYYQPKTVLSSFVKRAGVVRGIEFYGTGIYVAFIVSTHVS
jgi:hypothetical protein